MAQLLVILLLDRAKPQVSGGVTPFRADLNPGGCRSRGRGRLRGQRHRSGLSERRGEPGEDGKVGVEGDPLDAPDPQGQ
jgi:hypothetical protein